MRIETTKTRKKEQTKQPEDKSKSERSSTIFKDPTSNSVDVYINQTGHVAKLLKVNQRL